MSRRDLTAEEREQIKHVINQARNVDDLSTEELAEINRICAPAGGDPREKLTDFIRDLTKMAAETLSQGKLADDQKEVLKDSLHRLTRFAAKIKNPPVDLSMDVLAGHLEAVFLIGSFATKTQAEMVTRAKINAKMERLRKPKEEKSQAIDATILELRDALLKRNKRRSKRWIAQKILDDLLRRHPDSPARTEDALARRLSRLEK